MTRAETWGRRQRRGGTRVATVALGWLFASCLLALRLARERRAYRAGRIAAVRSRIDADRRRR